MRNYQYINIFDDELYDIKAPPEDIRNKELLDTIRLQVLLAILFDQQIVVPEQWATSSASFLKIASEVLDGFHHKIIIEGKDEKKTTIMRPPIVISFFNQNGKDENIYNNALLSRINSKSRLQMCNKMANTSQDDPLRNQLREVFEAERERRKEDKCQRAFEVDLLNLLGNDVACQIVALNKYLLYNTEQATCHFSKAEYFAKLASNVQKVDNICFHGKGIHDCGDSRIEEFQEFFIKAKKDGINYAEIARLWGISMSEYFSVDARNLITKMGQYCLHTALSECSNANNTSLFYGDFGNETYGFEEKMINGIRELEMTNQYSSSTNYDYDFNFFSSKHSANYDFKNTINWKEVWKNIAVFSVSEQWKNKREELKRTLQNKNNKETDHKEMWLDIFDHINSKIKDFSFTELENNQNCFQVKINPPKGKEALLKAGISLVEIAPVYIAAPLKMIISYIKDENKFIPFSQEIIKVHKDYKKAVQMPFKKIFKK